MPRRGFCLVLSAPSGAGKSTISRALLQADPDLTLSISATTRAPRHDEHDGVHYLFRSEAQFATMVQQGEMLEWAGVFGRNYGTPRRPVQAALAEGRDVVFDIDWQGHRQLRQALPGDVVSVFVLPPSLAALQTRLRLRGDAATVIAGRMAKAAAEISHWREFDYAVVNDAIPRAVQTIAAIVAAARAATGRRIELDGWPSSASKAT